MIQTTSASYSPWDLLPADNPMEASYDENFFYNNVAKHLVRDTVRILDNGLGIDLDKVHDLEFTIDSMIERVEANLSASPIIESFLKQKHSKLLAKKIKEREERLLARVKTPDHFLKPFKHKDMVHRSYFMYIFAQQQNISQPTELLPGTSVPKWEAKLVKKLSTSKPLLVKLLDGTLSPSHSIAIQAMQLLAEHKCTIHNDKLVPPTEPPEIPLPKFNPRSPDDRNIAFVDVLGLESGKLTDGYEKYQKKLDKFYRYGGEEPKEPKNKWSWGRKQLEAVKELISDPDQIHLFDNLVEFSFGDKIKSSFIPAFYKYTVNGRLYSNLKLLGAKSARFTSSNP